MRIAVDVDGVLADIINTWILVYNLPFQKEHVTEYNFGNLKGVGVTLDSFMDAHTQLWKMGVVRPETTDLARKVPSVDFDIVTARPRGGCHDVKVWLDKHKVKYGKILCVEKAMDKPNLNYDIYIDDSPYLHEYFKIHQIQIMISQPWNRLIHHDQVKRAVTLEHASLILQGLMHAES